MKKGTFSIIISSGKVIVAIVKFEDGDLWDICNKGYDLNQSHNNKSCWVEETQIYLDEYRDRKLKQELSPKTVKSQSHQQNQDSQQTNEMSIRDCIHKQTVLRKTRLPKDTRESLVGSNNAFDNFSLKLNKAARFDCRVKIEEYKRRLCIPRITDDLRDIVRYEDEEGCSIAVNVNPKYLSVYRPLTDMEKKDLLDLNPMALENADKDEKIIANKKRSTVTKICDQSKYPERKFRFCETDKDGLLYQPASFFGSLDFGKVAERHRSSIKALKLSVSSCEGEIDWRLIVGLGNESVYDTSMTLHHVYGIPYIPASAVKGVVRSWIITERFGRDEKDAIKDKGFCDVFGCPQKIEGINSYYNEDRQGKVWFFDAFPLSEPKIEVDIMNPHYMPYYNGDEPPADYHDPKPIPFLTVKHGTQFQFLIGIKEKDIDEAIGDGSRLLKGSNGLPIKVRKTGTNELVDASADPRLLNITEAWLKKALEEHGIGAKTAVGYGYMKDFKIGEES
jgi:CRISPR-associated protein Cmr6